MRPSVFCRRYSVKNSNSRRIISYQVIKCVSNIDSKECVGIEIETHLYLQYWQFFLVFSVTSQLPSLIWNITETLSATTQESHTLIQKYVAL